MKVNAELIKKTAERRGLSQAAIARLFGVSKMSVSYWMSGQRGMRLDRVVLMAGLLGVSMEDLRRDEK